MKHSNSDCLCSVPVVVSKLVVHSHYKSFNFRQPNSADRTIYLSVTDTMFIHSVVYGIRDIVSNRLKFVSSLATRPI